MCEANFELTDLQTCTVIQKNNAAMRGVGQDRESAHTLEFDGGTGLMGRYIYCRVDVGLALEQQPRHFEVPVLG